MRAQNIGIYIGAFDPIHEGHLKFAKNAVSKNKLDKLYFLVEPRPRHRQGVKALEHRINMVMLGVEGNDVFGTIVVKSKAIIEDYMFVLQKRFADQNLFLIVPEEDVTRLIKWSSIMSLDHENLNFAIGVSRFASSDIAAKFALLSETTGLKLNHQVFASETKPNQTTDVRRKLRKGERPQEIPKNVYEYISRQSLYAPSD